MKEKNIPESLSEAIEGYFTNKLTQEQAEKLIAWLEEDNENKKYLAELGKTWYASGLLSNKETDEEKAWLSFLDKIEVDDIRPMTRPSLNIPLYILYRLAAAVVLIGALGIGSIFIFKSPSQKQDVAYFEALAPKGSRSFITLSDGSTVWLNSGTRLRYKRSFGQKDRELYLEGEAYFVVAKNKEIPFRVNTPEVCITATGTAFNVKAYADENVVETTLEKGEVRIETLDKVDNKSVTTPVILKPNQKAVFTKSTRDLSINQSSQTNKPIKNVPEAIRKVTALRVDSMVDTRLSTSWKDSRWIFRSEKLRNLVPILERRYDVVISFRDSVLSSYKFTGTLKEESLEQVLNAICLASPIKYEINHNNVLFFEDQNLIRQYHNSPY